MQRSGTVHDHDDTERSRRLAQRSSALLPGFRALDTYEYPFADGTSSGFADLADPAKGLTAKVAVYNARNPADAETPEGVEQPDTLAGRVIAVTGDGREIAIIVFRPPQGQGAGAVSATGQLAIVDDAGQSIPGDHATVEPIIGALRNLARDGVKRRCSGLVHPDRRVSRGRSIGL